MRIQLSDSFTYRKLLRFVLPSVVMMVFTSIYGVVDGLFVSNYAGKTPFAAVNLVYPVLMLLAAIGFMMGSGGSALVAMTLGQGNRERANRIFSMLVTVTAVSGAALTLLGEWFLPRIVILLGADESLIPDCLTYGRIILLSLPFFMLTNMFQTFLITAEKPKLGLAVTVGAGMTNIALDYLLVGVLPLGIAGAAWATAASQAVGGLVPMLYFARRNDSLLRLTAFRFDGRALWRACTNGSSELMTNISLSLVNILYNWQLMRLIGEDGVAAWGVVMYVSFIFIAIFLGYSVGVGPVIGFHYGAGHHDELRSLLRKSLVIIGLTSLVLTVLSEAVTRPLTAVFVGYDAELWALTRRAFAIYSVSFLICGFNIFGSAFFTALGNGAVSAVISFLRTLLFQVMTVLLLPLFWGLDGVWAAIVVAEGLALVVTAGFLVRLRGRYHYG